MRSDVALSLFLCLSCRTNSWHREGHNWKENCGIPLTVEYVCVCLWLGELEASKAGEIPESLGRLSWFYAIKMNQTK